MWKEREKRGDKERKDRRKKKERKNRNKATNQQKPSKTKNRKPDQLFGRICLGTCGSGRLKWINFFEIIQEAA